MVQDRGVITIHPQHLASLNVALLIVWHVSKSGFLMHDAGLGSHHKTCDKTGKSERWNVVEATYGWG